LNPHSILHINGREACQMYLLVEIQKVYRSQGQNINDKHFEVIIRKMLGKVQVIRPVITGYLPQDLVDRLEIRRANEHLVADAKQPARFAEVLLRRHQGVIEHRFLAFGFFLPAHHKVLQVQR